MGQSQPHPQRRQRSVLLLGQPGSGKTELLMRLALGEVERVSDSGEYTVDWTEGKGLRLGCIRSYGQHSTWRKDMGGASGYIYMLDSAEGLKCVEATRRELEWLGEEGDKPVLLLANKQDKEEVHTEEILGKLESQLGRLRHKVFRVSAVHNTNVLEGFEWFLGELAKG